MLHFLGQAERFSKIAELEGYVPVAYVSLQCGRAENTLLEHVVQGPSVGCKESTPPRLMKMFVSLVNEIIY